MVTQQPYPATLSTGYNTTAFPGTYSISYTKDGSSFSGEPKDAGVYTASVMVGTGETAKTASVNYTIAKDTPTVTAPTTKTLTYTGSAQALVNAGSTDDGMLYYAVTTENKAPTDDKSYATEIPTKTDAGT